MQCNTALQGDFAILGPAAHNDQEAAGTICITHSITHSSSGSSHIPLHWPTISVCMAVISPVLLCGIKTKYTNPHISGICCPCNHKLLQNSTSPARTL